MSSKIVLVNLVTFDDDRPACVVGDLDTFNAIEPHGFAMHAVSAIQVDGAWYPLAAGCPAGGYAEWTSQGTPDEQAKEAAILALPQASRDLLFPDFQTRAQRIAKKQADDQAAKDAAKKTKA